MVTCEKKGMILMEFEELIESEDSIIFGLIKGRHNLPVNDYLIESDVSDPSDYDMMTQSYVEKLGDIEPDKVINVLVTGLTSATTTLIRYAMLSWRPLTLWHYDFATQSYKPQVILSKQDVGVITYDHGVPRLLK